MTSLPYRRSAVALAALLALAAASCTTETVSARVDGGDEPARGGRGGTGGTGGRGGQAGTGNGGAVAGGGTGGGVAMGDASVAVGPVDAPSGSGGAPGTGTCDPTQKKSLGMACGCKDECLSGFCADGVCCNLACTGACASCNQQGKMGECGPVARGLPDPHQVCKTEAATTCGQNGLCNGFGACSKHPPGAVCKAASCSGNGLVPASSCDGNGTCIAGSPINCSPSICSGSTCKLTCATNADCAAPHTCRSGSCGLRGLGQQCTAATQCKSGFCADGVCCDSACAGKCSFCGLPSALGRCVPVAADAPDPRGAMSGVDPARVCADAGPGSCGTNGRCDGAGGCQRYPSGTVCKNESCDPAANRWTGLGVCRNGACAVPQPRGCTPFKCEGNRCASSCGESGQCVTPNICQNRSCGKKPPGSLCSQAIECSSGFCAQGVCCNTACSGSCNACNLPGTVGVCNAVPDGGNDPTGTCRDEGPSSCGNDGACNGAGGCRKYGASTICAAAKCSAGQKTTASTCSGTGQCVAGTTLACGNYVCNADGTDCYSGCAATSAQCAPPNKCFDGKCGLAGQGQACQVEADCKSPFRCSPEGVCCDQRCDGGCKTCNAAKTLGKCTNLGVDQSDNACKPDSTKPCSFTGKCNGAGGCAVAASGITCGLLASCNVETNAATLATSCDGKGVCKSATVVPCDNNRCEDGACKPCSTDADCLNNVACMNGLCGSKLANGRQCSTPDQCASGACVEGFCCNRACSDCEECVAGACTRVADNVEDESCADVSVCGKTGKCKTGACETVAAGTVCGYACSGTDKVAKTCAGGMCTGSGQPQSCSGFLCVMSASSASCPTGCDAMTNANCPMGKICVGGSQCATCEAGTNRGCPAGQFCLNDACVNPGAVCTGNANCPMGLTCVDGYCCKTSSCGICQACGSAGDCVAVKSGPDADSCPNDGKCKLGCDDAGACKLPGSEMVCANGCQGDDVILTSCNGMGACMGTTMTMSCTAGRCAGGMCGSACSGDGDCIAPNTCIKPAGGATGSCGKKGLGATCSAANQCATGLFCTDGRCCSQMACDGECKACGSDGLCGAVRNGSDPDSCMNETGNPATRCGFTGTCNGDGVCAKVAMGTSCGTAGCNADNSAVVEPKCDGAGICAASTSVCGVGMACSAGACGVSVPPTPDAGVDGL